MTTRAVGSTLVSSQHRSRFAAQPASRLEEAIAARLEERPVRERERAFNPQLELHAIRTAPTRLGASSSSPSFRPATSHLANPKARGRAQLSLAPVRHPRGGGHHLEPSTSTPSLESRRPFSVPAPRPLAADADDPPRPTVHTVNVPFRVSRWQVHSRGPAVGKSSQPLPPPPPPPSSGAQRRSTRSLAPLGYDMPRSVERACDSFDERAEGLTQRLSTLVSRLDKDTTSERAQLDFYRSLAELRAQRFEVQPLRWRGGELDDVLSHGGFSGSRNPRAPPRGRPPRHDAWTAKSDLMSKAELDAAEARLAELRRRKAAGLLTDEERREMEALERKLAAHHAAKAKGVMSADELNEA